MQNFKKCLFWFLLILNILAQRIEDNETLKQTAMQTQKDREAMLEHWRSVYNKKLQRMSGPAQQLQDRSNSQQDLLSEVRQTVPYNYISANLSKQIMTYVQNSLKKQIIKKCKFKYKCQSY